MKGNNDIKYRIPGWSETQLTDAVSKISTNGKKIKQENYLGQGAFPIIDQGQHYIGGYTNDLTKLIECDSPLIVFGDHTRVTKYVCQRFAPGADGVVVLSPPKYFVAKLFWYLIQYTASNLHSKGYARHYQHLEKSVIPIPPANEQARILAKIEKLFSDLDMGVESLKTAREQLQVYRQALLKSAFEGSLTAAWRKANKNKLENSERLITRIKLERETQYKIDLDRWSTAVDNWEKLKRLGKQPVKPRKQKDVGPIDEETLRNLPKLPENWIWVRLGHLTWSVKDGPHYSPKYQDEGIPFISGGNVRPEGVDFSSAKFISRELHAELCERCNPAIGDILYTKGGTTGIARVNTYETEFNVWVHVAVLKVVKSVAPFFLQHALNSHFCHVQAQRFTHGVGNQDLGLTRMVNIILPICGADEQQAVVSEVERFISEIDDLQKAIDAELLKAESLRQSVLKNAFSGKLIAQDPNDEPASVLVERIKGEQVAEENGI